MADDEGEAGGGQPLIAGGGAVLPGAGWAFPFFVSIEHKTIANSLFAFCIQI